MQAVLDLREIPVENVHRPTPDGDHIRTITQRYFHALPLMHSLARSLARAS